MAPSTHSAEEGQSGRPGHHVLTLPLYLEEAPRAHAGPLRFLFLWSCASYLRPTTSLTFSVRGFCSLALLRSCSSCRWRASSSISLLSVILRDSFLSSRSFFV